MTVLAKLQTTVTQHAHTIDSDLFRSAKDLLSSATTFYEASIADGSLIVDSGQLEKDRRTVEWLERFDALRLETFPSGDDTGPVNSASPSLSSSSSPSMNPTADHTSSALVTAISTGDNLDVDESENDQEDDFALETAQSALLSGSEAFKMADYKTAESDLQEALALIEELPVKLRRACDISELRYKIGCVCLPCR